MSEARQERMFKARICEQAERYEDMVREMNDLVRLSGKTEPLSVEERNLLSVAYKNVVGAKRSSWRIISSKTGSETDPKHVQLCQETKAKIEKELNDLCGEILKLLNDNLIPCPENDEAKIFFLKMKGDYYRYMVEICESDARSDLLQKSEDAYQKALDVAKDKLDSTNPIRLGLALNYSVFLYEIKANPSGACDLAKSAFDEAIPGLEGVPEDTYKDTTLIMQLLRDNLTLWKSELEEENDNDV